jgi:hypothetical protein
MEFTCGGVVRCGFGFDNPNHAAALFVILIFPLLSLAFCARCYLWARILAAGSAAALFAALLSTCSRSGTAAFAAGLLLFFFLAIRFLGWRPGRARRRTVISCAAVFAALFAAAAAFPPVRAGFERSVPGPSFADNSALNRLKVWKGALCLLADNPAGTGGGSSGYIYTAVLHRGGDMSGYRTMVSSFLTLAVEHGVFAAWLVCGALFSSFLSGLSLLRGGTRKDSLSAWMTAAALCSIVSGSLCGALSTCFDLNALRADWAGLALNDALSITLSLLFAAAAVYPLISGVLTSYIRWLSLLVIGMSFSGLVWLGVFCAGCCVRGDISVRAAGGAAVVSFPESHNKGIALIKTNPAGPHELRHMISGARSILPGRRVAFFPPGTASPATSLPSGPGNIEIISRLEEGGSSSARTVIYKPKDFPPERLPVWAEMIVLDKFDASGVNRCWEALAAESGVRVLISEL